jgi:hypothetical protein
MMSWPAPTVEQRAERPKGPVLVWRERKSDFVVHPTNPTQTAGWYVVYLTALPDGVRTNSWEDRCHAGLDGECYWSKCPQEADDRANYQSWCPLASREVDDD